MTSSRNWFAPRRDWQGREALIPVDTCYQLLTIFTLTSAMAGTLALGFLAFVNGGAALGTTIYWCVVSVTAAMWAAAVLQGLRFTVRYGIFAGAQFTFLLLTVIGLGITPNWSFFAIVLLVSTGLFFGMRAGLWTTTRRPSRCTTPSMRSKPWRAPSWQCSQACMRNPIPEVANSSCGQREQKGLHCLSPNPSSSSTNRPNKNASRAVGGVLIGCRGRI